MNSDFLLNENSIPNIYFIPLTCYHTLEYYYLSEIQIQSQTRQIIQTNPIYINSEIELKTQKQIQKQKLLQLKLVPNIDLDNLECSICLEQLNIQISNIDKKINKCFRLQKILDKINFNICDKKNDNDLVCLECSHIFHSKCINQWCKNNGECPLCRKKITK